MEPADDWPLLPPTPELKAQLDEHGRVELLTDEPERLRSHEFCEHCGRQKCVWTCPDCLLRLCAAHRRCPCCDRER